MGEATQLFHFKLRLMREFADFKTFNGGLWHVKMVEKTSEVFSFLGKRPVQTDIKSMGHCGGANVLQGCSTLGLGPMN